MSNFNNIPIKEKIRLIKYNRFNGNEKCLISTIDGAIKNELEDRIKWYSKDGDKLLFELVNNRSDLLIVDYNNIWKFYKEFLGLNDNYIQSLIKKIVPEYLDIRKDITPVYREPYETRYVSY